LRLWAERIAFGAAALATLAVLGFYAGRLSAPLPLWAADEGAYLIRALWPDSVVSLDPTVASAYNGVHLSVIRAVYALGAPLVQGDRLVNAAAYLAGLSLIWRLAARRMVWSDQAWLGLIGLGFPYYRFAFTNLAEGLFVGVLAALCVVTWAWYRRRPMLHALAAGTVGAALVLTKPNGVATLAALAVVAVLDAALTRRWRQLPVRLLLFAGAFFAVGNLIQIQSDAPAAHPLTFFVSQGYGGDLALTPPPGAWRTGMLQALTMFSAAALLAGAPLTVGLADLWRRCRASRGRFEAEGGDLVFLTLALALAATIAMVALFAMQVSGNEGETKRLWGRYFEFFAPLIWLVAGPALTRPVARKVAWISATVTVAGLAGLLTGLSAGIVLFPWDAGILSAFFHADPIRAPLSFAAPYRGLAVTASLLAVAAMALRVRPIAVGATLILTLGVLSTDLDRIWVGPMVQDRAALARDLTAIRRALPARGDIVLLTPDANTDHLAFLSLDARPRVYSVAADQASAEMVAGARAVLVSGAQPPPAGPWRQAFKGEQLSLYRPAGDP
jgi:hypothetical protein